MEEEYNAILSARNTTQIKYSDLMRKLMEAQVAHGLEKEQKGERFTLIEPPRLPEKPFKPNRLAIMLIGVVLGIGAGVGVAALREFSDDAVRGTDKLEAETKFPVLAGIPTILSPGRRRTAAPQADRHGRRCDRRHRGRGADLPLPGHGPGCALGQDHAEGGFLNLVIVVKSDFR